MKILTLSKINEGLKSALKWRADFNTSFVPKLAIYCGFRWKLRVARSLRRHFVTKSRFQQLES